MKGFRRGGGTTDRHRSTATLGAPETPSFGDVVARRDEILELARRRGASNVRVFGSTARGQATVASDIDFLISLDEGRTLFDLGAFWHQLENLLGRDVDVVPEDSLDPSIPEHVLKEAVPL